MDAAVAAVLVLAGVIHLLPVTAVRSAGAVARTYGVPDVDDGNALLLRHRAVMLGVVGTVLLAGAADEDVRPLALALGIVSTASYVWLGRSTTVPALRKVLIIDLVLLVLLVAAAAAAALS